MEENRNQYNGHLKNSEEVTDISLHESLSETKKKYQYCWSW